MIVKIKVIRYKLGCTDAAPRPAHPRPTRRDAGTWQGCRRPRVRAVSDRVVPRGKSRIGLTRLKLAPIRRKSAPMRPKLGRLDPYRPVSAETAESGRNSKKKKKKKCRSDRLTWCRDFFIKNVWCRLSFGKGKPWGNKIKKKKKVKLIF